MPSPRHASSQSNGFTLVELLIALGIAALVVAVVYAAHHTVMRTVERHRLRSTSRTEIARALDQVSRDLASALPPTDAKTCPFILVPPGAQAQDLPRLSFCATVPSEQDPDLKWFTVEHIAYYRTPHSLLRVSQPLQPAISGARAVTNELVRGLRTFAVDVRSGEAWVDAWPEENSSALLPAVARVSLSTQQEPDTAPYALTTEIYIPAGQTVTSTLTRTIISDE